MWRAVPSGTGRSTCKQAPEREMSSRLATPRRVRPLGSFHWMSTRSAHSILGSTRRSNIIYWCYRTWRGNRLAFTSQEICPNTNPTDPLGSWSIGTMAQRDLADDGGTRRRVLGFAGKARLPEDTLGQDGAGLPAPNRCIRDTAAVGKG